MKWISMETAALAYARRGLPVFPLQGKLPLVAHGFYDASTDIALITAWWQRWPAANIGIPTGKPSGWIALDVDTRHGGLESLRHLQHAIHHRASDGVCTTVLLLATRLQYTGGGGLHLLFRRRDDVTMPLRNAVGFAGYAGLDLRGDGGYLTVSPSLHASGQRYRWLSPAPLLPFPDALIELVQRRRLALSVPRFPLPAPSQQRQRSTSRRDPAHWLDVALARAPIGKRHDGAFFLACRLLQDAELSPAQAESWMRSYAERVPQNVAEPYPVSDALSCLRWVATHLL
jgi:hypothetical protein